jgi:hypothetical protein
MIKSLLSDEPKKDAIILYRDGQREVIEGCQGHWDAEDVIHLCLEPEQWKEVDRVFFIL